MIRDSRLTQFDQQKYLNLETYRRNGSGVKTPVWFVEDGGVLYVRTLANSGKVKRIRRNSHVRVAPCDARGELLGEWMDAQAELVGADQAATVEKLLKRKYGLEKTLFDMLGRLNRSQSATLAIRLIEPEA